MMAFAALAGQALAAKAPELAVVAKLESALNAGDVAGAVAVLTPDAAAKDPWGRVYSGREQIQGWFSDLVRAKYRADSGNRQLMDGGRVIWTSSVADDQLRSLKVAPVDAAGEAIVRDEKVASLTIRFSASAHIKVAAALNAANREIVRSALDAIYNLRQAGAVTVFLDSAFTDHDPAPGQKGDRDGFRAGMKEMLSAFPDLRVTPDDLLVDGDKVTARLAVRGSHAGSFRGAPPSGKSFGVQEIQVFRIKDGKIVERWGPDDQDAILAQLGAKAAPAPVVAAASAAAAVEPWKVEIKDTQGRVVKTFGGTGAPPRTLVWEGAAVPAAAPGAGGTSVGPASPAPGVAKGVVPAVKEPVPEPMSAESARKAAKPKAAQPKEPPVTPLKKAEPMTAKPQGMETPPAQVGKKKGIYWY